MKPRYVSLLLNIIGTLMFIGGTIYFIIGYNGAKDSIQGLTNEEEIRAAVQPFIGGMMIWVMGNFLLVTFIFGVAAVAYAMKSTYFKGDKLLVFKVILTFVPIIMCAVYFLITQNLMP